MKTRCFILLMFVLCLSHLNSIANLSKDWISYLGQGNTRICAIEADTNSNHIYIVGTTSEIELGTFGVHQPNLNDSSSNPMDHLDIFVAKFSTSGALVWFTYYGGSKIESNPGLAIDKLGNIYLTGYSQSASGIASPGAFKTGIIQGADFIAKFNPQGQRLWATYYNERNNILPFGPLPAVDEQNNVCMLGLSHHHNINDIATPGTHQPEHYPSDTGRNAYLVKFNGSGQRIWGTYFGGGGEIWNKDIRTDKQNNIYITGVTSSTERVASPGAMITTVNPFREISFLAKFNANGQRTWSTYIHTEHNTFLSSIAVDAAMNVYAFGTTPANSGIATAGAWQAAKSDDFDFFLVKLNSSGQKVWGTYYGGEETELAMLTVNGALDINFTRNRLRLNNKVNPDIYVSGFSGSFTGMQKGCTIPVNGNPEGILSRFSNNGQLIWGSRYDATIFDFVLGKSDSLYFAGNTVNNNLASSNAHQTLKPSQAEAGLFGKFIERFICPASFTVNFSRVNDTLKAQAGYLNYQWFRNDTLLQNGPQNYYALMGDYGGVYRLKILDSCNCTFNSDTVSITNPISVNNTVRNTLELSIAPNPATNKLNILLYAPGKEAFQFRIYNILGRKVFETTSKLDADNKKVIDLSNYAPGLYILNVENREGKASIKFIRQ